MTVFVDFSERMRGESRHGFIRRKLEQARDDAVKKGYPIDVKGIFYNSDLKAIKRFANGLEPENINYRREGLGIATFHITASTQIT